MIMMSKAIVCRSGDHAMWPFWFLAVLDVILDVLLGVASTWRWVGICQL